MNFLTQYNEEPYNNWKYLLLFMVIAYAFSFAIRLIWVSQIGGLPDSIWNNQIMINTNDGYYFASAAKHILTGSYIHNPQIQSAINNYPVMVYLTAYAAKLLPFSLETVILYMPAVISSLLVIPMIMMGRLIHLPLLGFFSALLSSIAWSYYNRTMVGYFDTDMFSVLMQIMVLYSMLSLIIKHRTFDAILTFITITSYPYFYPQGLSLIYGMFFIYIIYSLLFLRKNNAIYFGIAAIAIALLTFPIWIKITLLAVIWWLFRENFLSLQYRYILSVAVFLLFLIEANVFTLLFVKFSDYLNRGTQDVGLHFYQVIQTVREAGKIPFEVMANRISGSSIGVLLSLAGYILLVFKRREFIIALPLIGIGIFSLFGGLRFTVYAVPVAAFSAILLSYYLANFLPKLIYKYLFISLFTLAMLYPNITHIIGYKVPTVFSLQEVQILDNLKNQGSNKDYIITWWDYGYPLWFYTNKNTLIDGGKHHNDNYIVSSILTSASPQEAARLSRIAVETYVDSNYSIIANTLFKNKQPDQINVADYMEQLRYSDVKLPKKTRDIYLYMPLRMLDILPTVKVFSNIDLETGKIKTRPFFYKSNFIQRNGTMINIGSGIQLDQRRGLILIGQQQLPIRQLITTKYQPDGVLKKQSQLLNFSAAINIIYMKDYGIMLVLDNEMLNSLYIQMFVLEQYDSKLFEAIELAPTAKVFKVKL